MPWERCWLLVRGSAYRAHSETCLSVPWPSYSRRAIRAGGPLYLSLLGRSLMCGIIGIVGKASVTPLLVEALKRLEYRGYDSAGVATLVNGHIDRRRAEGKLVNLEARLAEEPLTGTIGIGHTRWATHGKPSERNAHPIATDRVAIVHNGIIENFQELKDELVAEGRRFESDTDTEVVAQLLTSHLERQMSPE